MSVLVCNVGLHLDTCAFGAAVDGVDYLGKAKGGLEPVQVCGVGADGVLPTCGQASLLLVKQNLALPHVCLKLTRTDLSLGEELLELSLGDLQKTFFADDPRNDLAPGFHCGSAVLEHEDVRHVLVDEVAQQGWVVGVIDLDHFLSDVDHCLNCLGVDALDVIPCNPMLVGNRGSREVRRRSVLVEPILGVDAKVF